LQSWGELEGGTGSEGKVITTVNLSRKIHTCTAKREREKGAIPQKPMAVRGGVIWETGWNKGPEEKISSEHRRVL